MLVNINIWHLSCKVQPHEVSSKDVDSCLVVFVHLPLSKGQEAIARCLYDQIQNYEQNTDSFAQLNANLRQCDLDHLHIKQRKASFIFVPEDLSRYK